MGVIGKGNTGNNYGTLCVKNADANGKIAYEAAGGSLNVYNIIHTL